MTERPRGYAVLPNWIARGSGLSANAKLVLLALSSRANKKGTCFPSLELLAEDADMSKSSAQRALRELRDQGIIDWEQRRAGGRGNLYRILVDLSGQSTLASGHCDHSRVVTGDHLTRTNEQEPKEQTPKPPSPQPPASEEFEEFYSTYPRKGGKGQARKNWVTAIRKVDPPVIIKAATEYATWVRGEVMAGRQEERFIPEAAPWLSKERWGDVPGPSIQVTKTYNQTPAKREWSGAKPSDPPFGISTEEFVRWQRIEYERMHVRVDERRALRPGLRHEKPPAELPIDEYATWCEAEYERMHLPMRTYS